MALAAQGASEVPSHESSALCGFVCGNHRHPGCLTDDRSVRLHSCELGTSCPAAMSSNAIRILPIINDDATDGVLPEIGAGGGGGDLVESHSYLEINNVDDLVKLVEEGVQDPMLRQRIVNLVKDAAGSNSRMLPLDALDLNMNEKTMRLESLPDLLCQITQTENARDEQSDRLQAFAVQSDNQVSLPRKIVSPRSAFLTVILLIVVPSYFRTQDILRTRSCAISSARSSRRRFSLVWWTRATGAGRSACRACSGDSAPGPISATTSTCCGRRASVKRRRGRGSEFARHQTLNIHFTLL